jgi:hypothetical protein
MVRLVGEDRDEKEIIREREIKEHKRYKDRDRDVEESVT